MPRVAKTYIVPKGVSGVYGLRHKPSGQVYVGGSGHCIYGRFRHHFVKLRQGKHATPKLQELWNKSNPEDFEQVIFCFCVSGEVHENEQKWILHYRERGLMLNGSPDAARKRWSNPEYRQAVSSRVREITTERWNSGSFTGTTGMKLERSR